MAFYALLMVADIVLRNSQGQVFVMQRSIDPYRGAWVIPGGHLEKGQTIEDCALAEVQEETGLMIGPQVLHLVGVFSQPDRDPRSDYQRISICFLVNVQDTWQPKLGEESSDWKWVDPTELGRSDMGFDHFAMIQEALQKYPRYVA